MSFTLRFRDRLLPLHTPIVMAIINITSDSFYASHGLLSEKELIETTAQAIAEGASIIDIGALSTRPHSEAIPLEEELRRIERTLTLLRKHFPEIPISVDTYRSSVAECAIACGGDMINDISGGTLDANMFSTIARLRVPYVLTHIKGNPLTMQTLTQYDNLIHEILSYYEVRIRELALLGISDIIIDPGFGFAKTTEQNYELLSKLSHFSHLNLPLLVGVSHKSMLYKFLDIDINDTLNATSIANTIALLGGAQILRVHEVKPAMEAIKIVQAINTHK